MPSLECYRGLERSHLTSIHEDVMAWTKPQFKVVSLCMEITTYAHSR
ncbi:MAG: pyrroloquinoline quinone precursor peptide PqqA [Gemmatimonas sp.]|nr:pyrroloquinoline quinone precursor peptide PqqA [Gemmatimonas sp.]